MGSADQSWFRLGENAQILFDPFEPNFIRPALEVTSSSKPNLGHLIFGRDCWQNLYDSSSLLSDNTPNDPLTQYFKMRSKIRFRFLNSI